MDFGIRCTDERLHIVITLFIRNLARRLLGEPIDLRDIEDVEAHNRTDGDCLLECQPQGCKVGVAGLRIPEDADVKPRLLLLV
jgi:hypothetical protein